MNILDMLGFFIIFTFVPLELLVLFCIFYRDYLNWLHQEKYFVRLNYIFKFINFHTILL